MSGMKFDKGKPRWSLLPIREIESIVDVLTAGAVKYSDDNWKIVDNMDDRYYDAAMRHLAAWRMGERFDKETGLPHLAHLACNILFLMWHDNDKNT